MRKFCYGAGDGIVPEHYLVVLCPDLGSLNLNNQVMRGLGDLLSEGHILAWTTAQILNNFATLAVVYKR